MRWALCTWLVAALCGCGSTGAPREFLPQEAGAWRRVALRGVPIEEAPEMVPRSSVRRIQEGVYRGPGKLEARIYEMGSAAAALDLAQRWQPAADTVFFYQENEFAVVRWQQAERKGLQEFVRELEKRMRR